MLKLTALKKKNIFFLISLLACLIGAFVCYFTCVKLKPNDLIITTSEGAALFFNENPTFKVDFGSKENPQGQVIRFETQTASRNPFELKRKESIFTKIAEIFSPKKKYGIEMSLVGVNFSETKNNSKAELADSVTSVAEILGTDEIETSTDLVDMGRKIGEYDTEQTISKQTIVNGGVAEGIDLEYQILAGLGLKEEIVINNLEKYADSCGENCSLPLNKFEFDLSVDEGVVLKKGWFTLDGKSTEIYYFVDGEGKYLAHFLPSYAVDEAGNKTYEVDLDIQEYSVGKFKATVTVDPSWLLNEDRVYPIRIDPSIVHDETSDFSGGIFINSESITGPKIQLIQSDEFSCTGGTETTYEDYKIHTFTSDGTLSCVGSGTAEVLVVGGGGGGGSGGLVNSGGGGGGFVTNSNLSISGSISVTVGAGGAIATNGGNSVFSTITAYGGGAGKAPTANGNNGGSGGGGAAWNSTASGGTGTQGYNGGGNGVSPAYNGAGGGGAGAAGGDGNGWAGGAGGSGAASSITGTEVYYAGGGGGSGRDGTTRAGGLGGGGSSSAGTDGLGGGGSGGATSGGTGFAGGSGIVIVRYVPQEKRSAFSGEYISSAVDFGDSISSATLSWLSSGVSTGDGETPYSTTGLVAQWNFNETSGTAAVSGGSCGTSCNGILTSMATTGQDDSIMTGWTADNRRWGSGALMFDGVDDHVLISDNANITLTTDITIESWIKPLGYTSTNYNHIFDKDSSYCLSIYDGKLAFYLNGAGGWWYPNINTIDLNGWLHVVATYDGATKAIYVNGIKIAEMAQTGTIGSSVYDLSIGSRQNGTLPFYGIIDSPKLYSRALSADEVLSNYQVGNIEFQYRVSTDGATWSDWTSYNDGGISLDGVNDYITVGDVDSFDSLTELSVCSWVKHDTISDDDFILTKIDNSTWLGFMLLRDDVGQETGRTDMYKIYISGTAYIEGATNSSIANEWTQVCATFKADDATGLRLYVNGVEDPNSPVSTVGTTGVYAGTSLLSIGRYEPGGINYFNGNIDNIQVYSRVLPSSEIVSNYMVADGETPYSSQDIFAFWKMNELNGTTANVTGSCGSACNGTLTNFENTSGKDVVESSGWSSKSRIGSNSLWESFDEPYLYDTETGGLIGYWPMNETNGTSVADVIGSNTGATTGTVIVDGPHGKARSFNGSSGYMSASSVSGLSLGNTVFSMDMWIKPTATPTTRQWPLLLGDASAGNFHVLYQSDGGIFFGAWDVTSCSVTPVVGAWNHVAFTFDGTTGRCYLDGVLKSTATMTFNLSSTALKIAQAQIGEAYFNGSIDELRISSVVRTVDEIQSSYFVGTQRSNVIHIEGDSVAGVQGDYSEKISMGEQSVDRYTVGIWHLDERGGSGTYLKDSGNLGNHLTPTGTSYSNSGKVGGARSFNGSSDYISASSVSGLSLGNTVFSTEMWIKPTATPTTRQWPLLLGDASAGNFHVLYQSDGGMFFGAWDVASCSVTPVVGAWNHVAFTFDGTTGRCYLDGVLKSTATITFNFSSTVLKIAQAQSSEAYFNGSIDELRISSVVRTADEIANTYRLGKDGFVNNIVEEKDLSSVNVLPMSVAGDRPGSYLDAIWGETEYSNYQADTNTVALWGFDEGGKGSTYIDRSRESNSGITSLYGMRYGISSSNLTMIMNRWNGAANSYEMDITCPGGDSYCQIVTLEGETLSTTSINYGVAAQDTASNLFIMYSPSLSGQSITPYSNNSNNFIAVRYSSGWQYDNNSSWVSFTPKPYNILVAKALWGTSVTQLDYPSPAEGKIGEGLDFSGSDQITVLDDSSLDLSSSFTVEAWIKPDSLPNVTESGGGIVTKGGAGDASANNHNYWLSLCYNASWAGCTGTGYSFGFEVAAGSNYYVAIDEALELDTWHYLVGVFDDSNDELRLYHNGQLVKVTTGVTVTPNTQAIDLTIGGMTLADHVGYFDGIIDEVRISNIVRSAENIREVYETNLRTHSVEINFGAALQSSNLISGSGDTSFTIDATIYDLPEYGSEIYPGEEIIVKENYDGTEYIAQGEVATVNETTGAITVSSWVSDSTFPSGGYTTGADVFKWQTVYVPVEGSTISEQLDAVNIITLRITDGEEGRNIWIDDLRSSSGYMNDSSGETLAFPVGARYFQYKAIITSYDTYVTPYLSQVQIDYSSGGPTNELLMRHGKWFDNGVKRNFWWTGSQ